MEIRRAAFAAIVALSLAHFAAFDPRGQPIVTDVRFFLHFAERAAAGAVPYVDFVDYKGPLATLAGAALHRASAALGLDPLVGIRAGWLLFAAALAPISFLAWLRLSGGSVLAAVLGGAIALAPSLPGVLSATGNVPKVLAMVFANLALLAAARGSFFLAGVGAALAAMDWQPAGGLALTGTFAALLTSPTYGGRGAAMVMLGFVAGLVPFFVWFATHGALGAFVEQVFVLPAARPLVLEDSFAHRLHEIARRLTFFPGEAWLLPLGIVGAVDLVVRLTQSRGGGSRAPLAGFATFHLGIVAWALFDFQGWADALVLVSSLAFLASAGALRIAETAIAAARPRGLERRVGVLAACLLLLLVRPSFSRGGWRTPETLGAAASRWRISARSRRASRRWPRARASPSSATRSSSSLVISTIRSGSSTSIR